MIVWDANCKLRERHWVSTASGSISTFVNMGPGRPHLGSGSLYFAVVRSASLPPPSRTFGQASRNVHGDPLSYPTVSRMFMRPIVPKQGYGEARDRYGWIQYPQPI
jgi:hypothetical protein